MRTILISSFTLLVVELFFDLYQYRPFRKDVSQYQRILSEWKGIHDSY